MEWMEKLMNIDLAETRLSVKCQQKHGLEKLSKQLQLWACLQETKLD